VVSIIRFVSLAVLLACLPLAVPTLAQSGFDDTRIEDLPHIDHQPTDYVRRKMLPYVLAGATGILGGLLAYSVRIRTFRRHSKLPARR